MLTDRQTPKVGQQDKLEELEHRFLEALMNKTVKQLAEELKLADTEYQFAFAAGEPMRLLRAISRRREANAAYHQAKRHEFRKSSRRTARNPSRTAILERSPVDS